MKYSSQALVLAALALDAAIATPTLRHLHLHKGRDVVNWNDPNNYLGVDWSTVNYGGSSTPTASPTPVAAQNNVAVGNAPAKATASSAAPASSSPPSSGSQSSGGASGSCIDISQVWKKGDTSRGSLGSTSAQVSQGWTDGSSTLSKRADPVFDNYAGNSGASSQYGRNMVPLSNCDDQSHAYSIKFINTYSNQIDVAMWNNVGDNNVPLSGASRNSFFMFTLPPGQAAAFAFQPNSQFAFSEVSSQCQRQAPGMGVAGDWDCIWGEVNFAPSFPANGMSSWDVSLNLDPKAAGQLTLTDGTANGISSRSRCGFMGDQGQANAGAASQGKTCAVNSGASTVHLQAKFGANDS